LVIGCAAGHLGRRLKELGTKEVVGVEIDPEIAEEAKHYLDHVIVGDIEELSLPFSPQSFDCIICADVLEHLRNPGRILNRLREYLSDNGVLIASVPNVRYLGVINHLVEGNWSYQDSGFWMRPISGSSPAKRWLSYSIHPGMRSKVCLRI